MHTPIQHLYAAVRRQVAEVEATLKTLREEAKPLVWGSTEEHINELQQRYCHGQLVALAGIEGRLEALLKLPINFEFLEDLP